jgi:hypothetical protein
VQRLVLSRGPKLCEVLRGQQRRDLLLHAAYLRRRLLSGWVREWQRVRAALPGRRTVRLELLRLGLRRFEDQHLQAGAEMRDRPICMSRRSGRSGERVLPQRHRLSQRKVLPHEHNLLHQCDHRGCGLLATITVLYSASTEVSEGRRNARRSSWHRRQRAAMEIAAPPFRTYGLAATGEGSEKSVYSDSVGKFRSRMDKPICSHACVERRPCQDSRTCRYLRATTGGLPNLVNPLQDCFANMQVASTKTTQVVIACK